MSVYSNKVAFFRDAPKDSTITKTYWVSYSPIAPLRDSSVVEFNVPAASRDYVDLSKSKLYVKARIIQSDGTDTPAGAHVTMSNLMLWILFRQFEILLNNSPISTGVSINNPYKAFIDCLLLNSEGQKESLLESEGYFKDKNMVNTTAPSLSENSGAYERSKLSVNSRTFDLIGPLSRVLDIAQQGKLILNGIPLIFRLFQTSNPFRLMVDDESILYKVELEEVRLELCYCEVIPELTLAVESQLEKTPALYPFLQSIVKTFTIAAGNYSFQIEDPYSSRIPAKMVVGLVTNQAYTGNVKQNPFNFQTFDLNFFQVCKDGCSYFSSYQPNYAESNYVNEFNALGLFKSIQDRGHDITRSDFTNGYCLYCFDLQSNFDKDLQPLKEKGHLRLSLRFASPLPEAVTVIAYGIFPDSFSVDKTRAIIFHEQ